MLTIFYLTKYDKLLSANITRRREFVLDNVSDGCVGCCDAAKDSHEDQEPAVQPLKQRQLPMEENSKFGRPFLSKRNHAPIS